MPPHLGHHIRISRTTREQTGPTCARRVRHAHAIPHLAGACRPYRQSSHRLRRGTSAAREGGSGVHSMVLQSRLVRYAFDAGPRPGKHAGRVRITPRWLHFLRVSCRYP